MPVTARHVTDPVEIAAAIIIRRKVFVEEQGVPAILENDRHDHREASHYLAYAEDGTPVGAARWRKTPHGVKLERFAVLAAFRNQKAGAALLHAMLSDVKALLPDAVAYLNAQLPAVSFYERHGFEKEGEMFEEANIQHYKMVLGRSTLVEGCQLRA